MSDGPLTPEDYASASRATDELAQRGWLRFSLDDAVDQWASFVDKIERGYTLTIDDYMNDLSIRDWPEDARPLLTDRIAASMDTRLTPLDARFRAATNKVPWRVWSDDWWGQRIPKLLVGELAEDVGRRR